MPRSFYINLVVFGALLAIPHFAHAAVTNFFGPIVPDICNCSGTIGANGLSVSGSAPAWGCVLVVMQRILNTIVSLALVGITLFLSYSGLMFMINPTNEEQRSKARSGLLNAVIGLLIILGAWLLVNSIMQVLYNPAAFSDGAVPWQSILSSTDTSTDCLAARNPGALPSFSLGSSTIQSANAGGGTGAPGVSTVTTSSGGNLSGALNSSGVGSCSASTVQAGAAAGGYPISSVQANELACIAQFESTCGTLNLPYNLNYSWNKATKPNGPASSAAGAFQVLLSTNSACYDNPICEQVAGTPGQALNCQSGFSKGFPIDDNSALMKRCKVAAGNVGCSAAAAACQLQHQSFSSMYAADSHASSCQAQAGG